ncbi:MAG: hypothetical protein ACOX78_00320 [Lachnospiraceae bacterium]
MKRNRRTESSLLLGLPDVKLEPDALAAETASRAAAALAHFPGGKSWKKVLTEFAAQTEKKNCAYPGIAALILSGPEEWEARAREKAEKTALSQICTPLEAYLYIPALMLADTRLGTKERYFDLLSTLKAVPAGSEDDSALLMAAAVESMEWMEQAVYEVYRGFQDIFLTNARRLQQFAADGNGENAESPSSVLFASYAVLKACRLGAVLTERHAAAAEKRAEKIMKKADDSGEPLVYAAAALVYAEGIRNRDFRDYGAKNGGVLWS